MHGNMCFGIYKDYLILRLGEDQATKAIKKKYTKPFDITGRPMKGWVMVDSAGLRTENVLKEWVNQAIVFVSGLPRK